MKIIKSTVFISFLLLGKLSFSQSTPVCSHLSIKTQASEIVSYLFSKYGMETAESKLMQVRNYEVLNSVTVLCVKEFTAKINQIDLAISETTDITQIERLIFKKSKFILLSTIETQLF